MKKFFDLTEHEEQEELMRKKALDSEIQSEEHQAAMLEYFIENLDEGMLMAIHSTNRFPEKGRIRPLGHFLFRAKHQLAEAIIKDSELKYPRMTIHFTLNYAVKGVANSGNFYSWDCKYAILIPFIDIRNRVVSLSPVDTWIIGQLDLPRTAEILVPEEEYFSKKQEFEALSGKAKVIPYPKEERLRAAVIKRLKNKGYPVTNGGDSGWFEGTELSTTLDFIKKSQFLSESEKYRLKQVAMQRTYVGWSHLFSEIAQKLGKSTKRHDDSLFRRIEKFYDGFYGFIFNPTGIETETLLSEFMVRFSISRLTFQGLAANAELYQEKIMLMVEKEVFTHHQEKKDLKKLGGILKKIQKFCLDLQVKAQLAHNANPNITFGEFLKAQKIIE